MQIKQVKDRRGVPPSWDCRDPVGRALIKGGNKSKNIRMKVGNHSCDGMPMKYGM